MINLKKNKILAMMMLLTLFVNFIGITPVSASNSTGVVEEGLYTLSFTGEKDDLLHNVEGNNKVYRYGTMDQYKQRTIWEIRRSPLNSGKYTIRNLDDGMYLSTRSKWEGAPIELVTAFNGIRENEEYTFVEKLPGRYQVITTFDTMIDFYEQTVITSHANSHITLNRLSQESLSKDYRISFGDNDYNLMFVNPENHQIMGLGLHYKDTDYTKWTVTKLGYNKYKITNIATGSILNIVNYKYNSEGFTFTLSSDKGELGNYFNIISNPKSDAVFVKNLGSNMYVSTQGTNLRVCQTKTPTKLYFKEI